MKFSRKNRVSLIFRFICGYARLEICTKIVTSHFLVMWPSVDHLKNYAFVTAALHLTVLSKCNLFDLSVPNLRHYFKKKFLECSYEKQIYTCIISKSPILPYIEGFINCSTLNRSQENLTGEKKKITKISQWLWIIPEFFQNFKSMHFRLWIQMAWA